MAKAELETDPAPLMKLVALGLAVATGTVALLTGVTITPLGEITGTTVLVRRVTDGAAGVTDGATTETGIEVGVRTTEIELELV